LEEDSLPGCLKSWIEDFVDEDTGEVVSIERNEVIIDREIILNDDHIDEILEAGVKNILLHKEEQNQQDFAIIYNTLQKDPCNSEKEAVLHIYRQLRNAEPPDEATAVMLLINSSSLTNDTILVMWAVTASTRSLVSILR
jgi:hypothetical protein